MVRQVDAKLKGQIKLGKGTRVEVKGLEKAKELNGLLGSLLEFDPVKLRWGVQLDSGKLVALKMGNLIPKDTEVTLGVGPETNAGYPVRIEGSEARSGDSVVAPPQNAVADAGPSAQAVAEAPRSEATPAAAPAVAEAPKSEAKPAVRKTPIWELPEATLAATAPATVVTSSTDSPPADVSRDDAAKEDAPQVEEGEGPTTIDNTEMSAEDWPVLPTTAKAKAKARTGCWWEGGSAAKKFTEKLLANDPNLTTVCLVPPKRFNDEDAEEVCNALEANKICTELVASGHPFSEATCERIAKLLRTTTTLQTLSIGDGSLGDLASIIFDGLADNSSVTDLDLEYKGLTASSWRSFSSALEARRSKNVAPFASLRLSRNPTVGDALDVLARLEAPKELRLCECALSAKHGLSLSQWLLAGIEDLDIRDNSSFGGEGVEMLFQKFSKVPKDLDPPCLRRLRLDGCAIGDDGLEMLSDALANGLQLEDLYMERCEITKVGCEFLANALRGRRLQHLSVRANVIGDEGCTLLAMCGERLDFSSTSLSGALLPTLGAQPLVALELFSNPALGPSVNSWCADLDSSHWQRLEYLDLTGCHLEAAGFECVINTLINRPDIMPELKYLNIAANDVHDTEERFELVNLLGAKRDGKLQTKWQCNS